MYIPKAWSKKAFLLDLFVILIVHVGMYGMQKNHLLAPTSILESLMQREIFGKNIFDVTTQALALKIHERMLSVQNYKMLHMSLSNIPPFFGFNEMLVSPDTTMIICKGYPSDTKLLIIDRDAEISYCLTHPDPALCMAITSDNKKLFVGTSAGEIITWDMQKRLRIAVKKVAECNRKIEAMMLSSSGKLLFTVGKYQFNDTQAFIMRYELSPDDNADIIIDHETFLGSVLLTHLVTARLSPDNRWLIIADNDKLHFFTIQEHSSGCSARSLRTVLFQLEQSSIGSIALSPDSSKIFTAVNHNRNGVFENSFEDATLYCHSLESQELISAWQSTEPVTSLVCSAGGGLLISCYRYAYGSPIMIWDLDCQALLKKLQYPGLLVIQLNRLTKKEAQFIGITKFYDRNVDKYNLTTWVPR